MNTGLGGWVRGGTHSAGGVARRPPLIALMDFVWLGYLPIMALVSWCLPERRWESFCRMLARISVHLRPHLAARQSERLAFLLRGRGCRVNPKELLETQIANQHRGRLQCLRCYRIGGWRPRTAISGCEHVERALAAGRGCVLWVAPLAFSDIVTKMALSRAGFWASHLSRTEHGFSPSRFGRRAINPIWTSVECRFLAERLEMVPGQSSRALRALIRRVRGNGIVAITAGAQGVRGYAVPFANGSISLADGPPVLAGRTGAVLLPVFTEPAGPGAFLTTIEPPLAIPSGADREHAVRASLAQYAALLESRITRRPDLMPAWWSREGAETLIRFDSPSP